MPSQRDASPDAKGERYVFLDQIRTYVRQTAKYRFGFEDSTAEDLAQEVLIAVWKRFSDRLPPRPWVVRATRFECLRRLRTRGRRKKREAEYVRAQLARRESETTKGQDHLRLIAFLQRCLPGVISDERIEGSSGRLSKLAQEYQMPAGTLYRRVWEARRSASTSNLKSRRGRPAKTSRIRSKQHRPDRPAS
jgi:predicted RNA polymerase sigma factor